MVESIVAVTAGLLVLVFHRRLVRAIEASGEASAREIGGPVAWIGNPPPGSIRARVVPLVSLATVLVIGVSFVVLGILNMLSVI